MTRTKKDLQRIVGMKQTKYADDLFFGEELQLLHERLHSIHSSIVVIGQFSVGKSALLNALLGDELLSTRRIESTKVLTRIRYCAPNQNPSIVLQFQDGSSEEISVNDLSDLEKYTTFQGTGITDELRFVDVFWPLPFLDEQLMLVDTPGANSLTAAAFTTTEEALREASAVIYLFNGQKGIDQTDYQLLKSLIDKKKRIFLVATHVDDLTSDDWTSVERNVRQKLDEHVLGLGKTEIYPVSSIKALQGKQQKNDDLYVESQMGALEADLFAYMDKHEYEIATLTSISYDVDVLLNEIALAEAEQEGLVAEEEKERKQRLERLIAVTRLQYQDVLLQGEKLIKERFRRLDRQLDNHDGPIRNLKKVMKKRIQDEFKEFRKVVMSNMQMIALDTSPLEKAFNQYERQAEASYVVWEESVQSISHDFQTTIIHSICEEDDTFVHLMESMNTNVAISWKDFKQQLVSMQLKSVDLKLEQDTIRSYQDALHHIESKYVEIESQKKQTVKQTELAHQNYGKKLGDIRKDENNTLKRLGDMPSVEYSTEKRRKFLFFKETIEHSDDSKQQAWKEQTKSIKEQYQKQLSSHQATLSTIKRQAHEANQQVNSYLEQTEEEEDALRDQFMASIVETLNNNSTQVLQTYRYFEEELDSQWKLHKQYYLDRCEKHIDQVSKVFQDFVLQAEQKQLNTLYVN